MKRVVVAWLAAVLALVGSQARGAPVKMLSVPALQVAAWKQQIAALQQEVRGLRYELAFAKRGAAGPTTGVRVAGEGDSTRRAAALTGRARGAGVSTFTSRCRAQLRDPKANRLARDCARVQLPFAEATDQRIAAYLAGHPVPPAVRRELYAGRLEPGMTLAEVKLVGNWVPRGADTAGRWGVVDGAAFSSVDPMGTGGGGWVVRLDAAGRVLSASRLHAAALLPSLPGLRR